MASSSTYISYSTIILPPSLTIIAAVYIKRPYQLIDFNYQITDRAYKTIIRQQHFQYRNASNRLGGDQLTAPTSNKGIVAIPSSFL